MNFLDQLLLEIAALGFPLSYVVFTVLYIFIAVVASACATIAHRFGDAFGYAFFLLFVTIGLFIAWAFGAIVDGFRSLFRLKDAR